MNVCVAVHPPTLSQGIFRVARALETYAPSGVRCVPTWAEADLVLIHTIGIAGMAEAIGSVKDYAIFQYCTGRTGGGSPDEWRNIWRCAKLVSSYYELTAAPWEVGNFGSINFHRTPLGVDTDVFRPCTCAPQFLVGTSGYVADQECLGEWGVVAAGRGHFHLGPDGVVGAPGVTYANGVPDGELAKRWSRCRFVSGLRRVEGFELPAYEGLACGARPVMFDREDARHWMGEHAIYVREAGGAELIASLREVVGARCPPVTEAERQWVKDTFSWARFAAEWWARVL